MHHTSAACNITAFYDGSVIRYVARCCNLELLFQMYKGDLTKEQARQIRGIEYARVRVLCDGLLFLSSTLCIQADNPGVEIMEFFDEIPGNMKSGRWEELAEELIKHRTGIYFKYLRK